MNDIKLILVRHNRRTPAAAISQSPVSFNELTIVLRGSLEYYVNREKILLQGGDVIYVPKNSLRARKEATEVADYVSFNFQSDENWDFPIHIREGVTNEIRLQIAVCDELIRKYYPDHEDKISPLLLCMLLSIKSHLKTRSLNPLVSKITRYVHENMSQKITLADVGQHTFFSPVYCDTVFKREMGRSIIDYLLEKRIEEAKKLLIEGVEPLRRIAEAVGFHDYNYFARVFKKRTGYTPVQYRNNLISSAHR